MFTVGVCRLQFQPNNVFCSTLFDITQVNIGDFFHQLNEKYDDDNFQIFIRLNI